MKARGYQKLTVSNTAVGLTVPNTFAPGYALIRIVGANVMYRDDGTDPTTTDGVPVYDGDVLHYDGPLTAVKFIRQGSTDATAHISYYGVMG